MLDGDASQRADSFSIDLLSATYSTSLRIGYHDGSSLSSTTIDTAPVSDELLVTGRLTDTYTGNDVYGGTASADLFEVSTWSYEEDCCSLSSLNSVSAYATTALMFTPVESGTASMEMTFLTGGAANFSESWVTLVDLTTNTTVWSLGWEFYLGELTMRALREAPTTIATQFDASHLYQLTVFVHTGASDDGQTVTARVAGLHVVPEPSTALLVGLGACAVAIKRRRLRRP